MTKREHFRINSEFRNAADRQDRFAALAIPLEAAQDHWANARMLRRLAEQEGK